MAKQRFLRADALVASVVPLRKAAAQAKIRSQRHGVLSDWPIRPHSPAPPFRWAPRPARYQYDMKVKLH